MNYSIDYTFNIKHNKQNDYLQIIKIVIIKSQLSKTKTLTFEYKNIRIYKLRYYLLFRLQYLYCFTINYTED